MIILQTFKNMLLATRVGSLRLPIIDREEGQTLAEYVLIIGLVAVAVGAAVTVFQGDVSTIFDGLSSKL